MANKLNLTGLGYFYNRIKTIFASKTEVQTLSDRVDEIIAEGGEPNVIETVKVDGTALTPDSNKAVDITGKANVDDIPTDLSELTNTGADPYATKSYVNENGGKIDVIKVNRNQQTITNKTVDLEVVDIDWETDRTKIMKKGGLSSAVEFIEDTDGVELSFGKGSASSQTRVYKTLVDKNYVDGTFCTEAQVQDAIDAELTSVYKPGGTVEFASLPALTKDNVGYIYDVIDGFTTTADFVEGAGKTYPAHTNVGIIDKGAAGYFYDVFSGMVDLTNYWSKTELVDITTAEIDAIIDGD